MRLLGQILLACLVFTVLQALVALVAIAILLLLLWGLLFRPRETVGIIAFVLLLKALEVHPFATIGVGDPDPQPAAGHPRDTGN